MRDPLQLIGLLVFAAVAMFLVLRSKSPQSNTVGDLSSTFAPGVTADDLEGLIFGLEALGSRFGGGQQVGDESYIRFDQPGGRIPFEVSLDAIRQVFNVPPAFQNPIVVQPPR